MLGLVRGEHRRALGQAVSFEYREAQIVPKPRRVTIQRRAAGHKIAEARTNLFMNKPKQFLAAAGRQMACAMPQPSERAPEAKTGKRLLNAPLQYREQPGHGDKYRDRARSKRVKNGRRLHRAQIRHPRAHRQRRQASSHHFKHMRERQNGQKNVRRAHFDMRAHRGQIRREIRMRQRHALGLSGRAGRVDKHRHVALLPLSSLLFRNLHVRSIAPLSMRRLANFCCEDCVRQHRYSWIWWDWRLYRDGGRRQAEFRSKKIVRVSE